MVDKIKRMLEERNVWFSPNHKLNDGIASENVLNALKMIARNFFIFDTIRGYLKNDKFYIGTKAHSQLIQELESCGLVCKKGSYYGLTGEGRILEGGKWLEILAAEALREAGADALVRSQQLQWESGGYVGENEVDVLARKGEHLIFVNCKVMRTYLRKLPRGVKDLHRLEMRQALNEADNWVDHFGDPNRDCAVFVLTTDLIDEANANQVRYPALFGKAHALHVHLVPLDYLRWKDLVAQFRNILACPVGNARHV